MRSRAFLITAAAIVIAALIAVSLAASLLVDYLWFGALGFRGVFTTTLAAQAAIFSAVWAVTFLATGASGLLALRLSRDRERLHVVRRNPEVTEINLPELIRSLSDRIPWKVLILGVAAVLGFFVGQAEASSWDVYLKGLYGVAFGVKEPAFGLDVGFY
ncbi:MAG: UPF0182 family protein, partial [Candidatus Binataceae bacterium]